MYVRWKQHFTGSWGETYHAQLVESRRIDGKPRQRVIAYLGAYSPGALALCEREASHAARWGIYNPLSPAAYRAHFWDTVEKALAQVDAPDEVKARIRTKLMERVPALTEQERQDVTEYQSLRQRREEARRT